MKLHREKIIEFYDHRESGDGRGSDVAGLTGIWGEDLLIGSLQDYWRTCDNADSRVISYSCGNGKKKGPRLDAWILKTDKDGDESLYQVEVKNWCAYSLGERPLSRVISPDELDNYRSEQWDFYFGKGCLPKSVEKVLSKMKAPAEHAKLTPIPLLCFWFFISDKSGKPYSQCLLANGCRIDVFSASAYFRSLTSPTIEISMPRAERRFLLLSQLIAHEAVVNSIP